MIRTQGKDPDAPTTEGPSKPTDVPIVDAADARRKQFETLRALAALRQIRVYGLKSGYLASLGGGWCREVPDLRALAELLRRCGVAL